MYIIKNALRCIGRSKGRNILIGVIVLVIAVSACIGLSIRQAAESAKADTLETLSVTATISFDRSSMMQGLRGQSDPDGQPEEPGQGGGFDRSQFAEMMGQASGLSLEEYKTYAEADSVKDFYYTMTASLNGSDDFAAVTTETEEETSDTATEEGAMGGFGGGMGQMGQMGGDRGGFGMMGMMGTQGDFQITGYSGDAAMTDFVNGTSTITDGTVFTEGSDTPDCIISEELATFNGLAVGDSVTLTNPNAETETYTLTVVGIYRNTSANDGMMSMMGGTSSDPANQIYMSYAALQSMIEHSESVATTTTDETTGRETSTALTGMTNATYAFATVEDYYAFEEEVREMGLADTYSVSSQDITSFENSLTPLNTLSTMAGWFLLVILIIGAIILIVLNIFNVRERKYEIGVLTAMGMKKGKVAMQFLCEIFAVTLVSVLIGAIIGAVCAVPVTNALLENQVSAQNDRAEQVQQNFGRGEMPGIGIMGGNAPTGSSELSGGETGGLGNPFGGFFGGANNYITEVNSAMNLTVVIQMLGIAILLTLAAGMVSMLFVMRYEPLKILANRD